MCWAALRSGDRSAEGSKGDSEELTSFCKKDPVLVSFNCALDSAQSQMREQPQLGD